MLQNHHRDSTFGTRTDSQASPQAVTMVATVIASRIQSASGIA